MLEEQLRTQLHIQDPVTVLAQQVQHHANRMNKPRRVKKQAQPKAEATIEDTINSLKNEIEYMPMKTPISILQELLSRRGECVFAIKKLSIFNLAIVQFLRNYTEL